MSIWNDKFRKARLDQSPYLFHFLKGETEKPFETLEKILNEQRLISQRGYICFSASPITAIRRFFEVNVNRTGKPMYLPWGIGFSRDILVRDFNARNVIYTDGTEEIPSHLDWRTMRLDVDSYDYEYLREWRIRGNEFVFSNFPKEHILVIAPNRDQLNALVVNFDMKFTPYVDYYNETIEEDWSEEFTRNWKGISVDKIDEYLDDFAVSGNTSTQKLGEDMVDILFPTCALDISIPKGKTAYEDDKSGT